MLGTARRCGRSGVLAARLRFGFAADLELSHVRLFYIYGDGIWIFLLLFWALAVVSPLRCRFLYPRGLSCWCLRPGVSRKLNRPRLISCAALPSRLVIALPSAIQGFYWVMFAVIGGITRVVYTFPVLPAYEFFPAARCHSRFSCVLRPHIEIFPVRLTVCG